MTKKRRKKMNDLIQVINGVPSLDGGTIKMIAEYEKAMKELKDKEDAIKQAILDEMEVKGILKVDSDDISISYIAPSERESFDSKTFRKEHSDLYDEYIKLIPVKSSIRMKIK